MEGGGERRGDVEVKREIKYQEAIKTRTDIKLPPPCLVCEAVCVLSSLFLASYLTLCLHITARYY